MKCSICGYSASCPCEFDNGICWTCKFGGKRINNKIVDNYCNQTLENLQFIKNKLILKPVENENPCRFKGIIDQILVN
jgi:hypothetical protein